MTDGIETQDAKKYNAEAFAMNIARAMESSGQALAAYLTPRATGEVKDAPSEIAEVIKAFSTVAEYWLSNNERAADLQARIGNAYLDLWGSAVRRMAGRRQAASRLPRDKRFKDRVAIRTSSSISSCSSIC
jgi:polyhydroxyalkanoate synthase